MDETQDNTQESSDQKISLGPVRTLPPLYAALMNPDELFVTAIIESIRDGDRYVPEALVHLFSAQQSALRLLRIAIEREVSHTLSEGTLFRGNSQTTKMLSIYADQFGKKYLIDTLQAPLLEVLKNTNDLEINPRRAEGLNVGENMKTLLGYCEIFLSNIIRKLSVCPLPFRKICRLLYVKVSGKFPSQGGIAVGGFIFLRFLVPAINMYQMKGIADKPPTKPQKKALLYVSKILQNLANNVEFGGKEAFMVPANEFILKNRRRILTFFDTIATEVSFPGSELSYISPTNFISQTQVAKALKTIAAHMFNRSEHLQTALTAMKNNPVWDTESIDYTFDRLADWMDNVRLPASEIPEEAESSSSSTKSLTLKLDPTKVKH